MYNQTLANSTIKLAQISEQTQENLAFELWGSTLCTKTKFLELLLSEGPNTYLIKFWPLGYRPKELVYQELPALRVIKANQTEKYDNNLPSGTEITAAIEENRLIEDFRLIWYYLEGQYLTPSAHYQARTFLDRYLATPLSLKQLNLLTNCPLKRLNELDLCQLSKFERLMYRCFTYPRAITSLRQQPSANNTKLNIDYADPAVRRIRNRYQSAAAIINQILSGEP